MAISAFTALSAAKSTSNTMLHLAKYFSDRENERTNLSNISTQQVLNNNILIANSKLVNEDQIREMRKFGLDMLELYRQSESAISGAKTANPYAINERSGRAAIRNVAAIAARARFITSLNFGTKLRTLDIERLNLRLGNLQQNAALFTGFTRKSNLLKTSLSIAGEVTSEAAKIIKKKTETGIDPFTTSKVPKTGFNTGVESRVERG